MDMRIYKIIEKWVSQIDEKSRVLEIGTPNWNKSLLSMACLNGSDLFGVNLRKPKVHSDQYVFIQCDANDMSGVVEDSSIDVVLCNAMLEHDRKPWRTASEINRILKHGGTAIVGVPSFDANNHLKKKGIISENVFDEWQDKNMTVTYRIHATPDYWRFSGMGIKALLEPLEVNKSLTFLFPPRTLVLARKSEK